MRILKEYSRKLNCVSIKLSLRLEQFNGVHWLRSYSCLTPQIYLLLPSNRIKVILAFSADSCYNFPNPVPDIAHATNPSPNIVMIMNTI